MRKFIFGLGVFALSLNCLEGMLHDSWGEFNLGGGYRRDREHWSLGEGTKRCPRSELRWNNVESYHVAAFANYANDSNYYFRGYGNYGWVTSGEQTDTDSIKRCDFSKSRAKVDKGEMYDISGGIGYIFYFLCDRAWIAPIVGYSYHRQQYQMKDLVVEIDEIDGLVGKVNGLNSFYHSRFKGWWVGADCKLYMAYCLELFGSAEYHWGHFRGKGHWNLRTDFIDDFRQHADSFGQIYMVGIRYLFSENWNVSVMYTYNAFRTRSGIDRVFLACGPVETEMHSLKWHTNMVTGYVAYRF